RRKPDVEALGCTSVSTSGLRPDARQDLRPDARQDLRPDARLSQAWWRLTAPPSEPARPVRRVVVLGSTGSIGTNTLDVIGHFPGRLVAHGLSAHGNIDLALEQARRFQPRWLAFTDAAALGHVERSQLSP